MVHQLISIESIKRLWEVFKFFLVGMIAGVPSFYIYHWMANHHYSEFVASIVSGIFFQIFNFLPQKYLTFNNTDRTTIRKQTRDFLLSGIISVIINAGIIILLDKYSSYRIKYIHDIHKIIADIICTHVLDTYIYITFIL